MANGVGDLLGVYRFSPSAKATHQDRCVSRLQDDMGPKMVGTELVVLADGIQGSPRLKHTTHQREAVV